RGRVNPVYRPVRELAAAVRTRAVSPVALTETFLERLERLGPRYNAVVTLTRDRALAQARRAEHEVAAGRWRGPLHGIPFGAKDLLAATGAPTTWGAAPLRAQTFDGDATVIRRLEDAGAVLVAKLAMVELAGGMGYRQPHASFTGPGISPWGDDAWSGGASSGSGSAAAAGLARVATGSAAWPTAASRPCARRSSARSTRWPSSAPWRTSRWPNCRTTPSRARSCSPRRPAPSRT